jgi:hypothetical protein
VTQPREYDDADELAHPAGPDPSWQESWLVVAGDMQQDIGVFARIARYRASRTGDVALGLFDRDHRFRTVLTGAPLSPDDGDGVAVGPCRVRYDGALQLSFDDVDAALDLRFDDVTPRWRYWDIAAEPELAARIAADHFQRSGRVTGTVRIGTSTHRFDGLGHRDHSWGPRAWSDVRTSRWFVGTDGAELSFTMALIGLGTDPVRTVGYVVRDGAPTRIASADVVVHLEVDGYTHRGGTARIGLADGTSLDLQHRVVDGIVMPLHGLRVVEGIGRVVTDGGLEGFADLEVCNHPDGVPAPDTRPAPAVAANDRDGLHRRSLS